ncbi:hypothetical protein [Flavobacterium soli]|uniref:hypothetical protein n=1 Tax=Flavobacterium soli TaxID=344881 RepID=UPI0004026C1A|nr:hypothetical protein [Flavobacterium soli]
MIEKPITQKQHLQSLANGEALLFALKKMHNREGFNIENLRIKTRPFFRTFTLGKSTTFLGLNLKHTSLSINAWLLEDANGLYCFKVVSTKFGESYPFTVWVKNEREFLQKIIIDYNLFNLKS